MRIILAVLGTTYFWLFSPESLVIITNGAAQEPVLFIGAFLLLALLVGEGARIIERDAPEQTAARTRPWLPALAQATGLGGIVGTTIFASTGILVTAGFTFNEVFLYYFPNFGFAFLLLGLTMTMHLFFRDRVKQLQAVLVGLVLCCLIGLTIYGFFVSGQGPAQSMEYQSPALLPLLTLLFIFAGFERFDAENLVITGRRRFLLFGSIILVLLGWMVISGAVVAPQKLGFSTVPYMTASAGIAGQTGRLIMGGAIICGSLAACSGLFMSSREYVSRTMARGSKLALQRSTIIALTITIGSAMAIGLAGESRLEVFIRGSLAMWLIHGGLRVFSAAQHEQPGTVRRWKARLVGLSLISFSGGAALLARDPLQLSIFFTCLLAGSFLCIMVVWLMHGYSASHERIINKKETLT